MKKMKKIILFEEDIQVIYYRRPVKYDYAYMSNFSSTPTYFVVMTNSTTSSLYYDTSTH